MEVKLQRLNAMPAAYVHVLSQSPEEDALRTILEYTKINGLTQKTGVRLFGRNTYPTDKPEPHGYEYYLTIDKSAKPMGQVSFKELPGGLYAALSVKNLFKIAEGWANLFSWVESSGHEPVGVTKGGHGWVNSAFEELVSWQQEQPPTEWVFNLFVQLRE